MIGLLNDCSPTFCRFFVLRRSYLTVPRVLPADITPQSVHLLGSWDNFRTAFVMEQDIRVGRGVWKYMVADRGGLEMGCEYTYYVGLPYYLAFIYLSPLLMVQSTTRQFLLDSKCCIPDPGSSPELTTTDPRTGRMVSILYVPVELPPSPAKPPPPPPPHVYLPSKALPPPSQLDREKTISPVSVIRASVFAGSGDDGGRAFEEPRRVPEHPTHSRNNSGSFKERIRGRSSRVSSILFRNEIGMPASEETSAKRKWSLVRKRSGFFRGKSKIIVDDGDKTPSVVNSRGMGTGEALSGFGGTVTPNKQVSVPPEPTHTVSHILGYLREETPEPAHDISHRTQPARAYYHSPVTMNTYTSPVLDPRPQMPRSISDASKRSTETTDTSPSLIHSLTSSCSCNDGSNYSCACSPMVQSAFSPEESCSSDDEGDEDEAYEVDTPVDGLGITTPYQPSERVYPKYYNFDEISGITGGNRDIGKYAGDVILSEAPYSGIPGNPKPLSCLREEVAGELAWRDELVDELGYLGGVVV